MTSFGLEEALSSLGLTEGPVVAEVVASELGSEEKMPVVEGSSQSPREANDSTCAICLNQIPVAELAQPEGCEHFYCTGCILHWAVYKDKPWCPQCKAPFTSLLTYRTLDGELHDYPCKESVCLLTRAHWFRDYLKEREQALASAAAARTAAGSAYQEGSIIEEADYQDYSRYYDEYDQDNEVENYYFSSAAGRARVVIGNRRYGPNGYLSAGRMQAQPTPPSAPKSRKEKGGVSSSAGPSRPAKGKGGKEKAAASPATPAGRIGGSRFEGSASASTDSEAPGSSGGKTGEGRRARRNLRRAAADARGGL
jgi:hypothetical protein